MPLIMTEAGDAAVPLRHKAGRQIEHRHLVAQNQRIAEINIRRMIVNFCEQPEIERRQNFDDSRNIRDFRLTDHWPVYLTCSSATSLSPPNTEHNFRTAKIKTRAPLGFLKKNDEC